MPAPTVHCQPSRLAARDPSSRWVKNRSSPAVHSAPARTVHCDDSHIRVWLTSQPSVSSSSTHDDTQFIASGHGSSQLRAGRAGAARRAVALRRPTRA